MTGSHRERTLPATHPQVREVPREDIDAIFDHRVSSASNDCGIIEASTAQIRLARPCC